MMPFITPKWPLLGSLDKNVYFTDYLSANQGLPCMFCPSLVYESQGSTKYLSACPGK